LNLARMLYGDSSGLLGKVIGQVSTNVVEVNNFYNFVEGMSIEFYHEGVRLGDRSYRIKSVNKKANFIYLDQNLVEALTDNDEIYIQGSKDKELFGLRAIFDETKNLYGLKRNENGWLFPHIEYNIGDITEMDMQRVIDHLEDSYGSSVDIILCSSGVKRALMEHLSTYKRNFDYMELNGGFKAMSFNGIPVVSDRFCPPGTMYMLNSKDFTLHQLCDWKWLEGEDGRVLKQVADKPTYKATLVKYAELICSRPCGQAMLTGITEK
ncbi:MAG: phage major capsid protein, partial [Clostridia bacterium]|nr:phage major capsid protein [Clostridia bacterium]